MPFRLSSMNPIVHVFFHHKKLDDCTECHLTHDGLITENLWKCAALAKNNNNNKTHNLARVENAPCWICISFNRQLLWTYKGVFVKYCCSSHISLCAATHPGRIAAGVFLPLSKLFCCRMWLLNVKICGSRKKQIKSGGEKKSLFENGYAD